MKSIKKTMILKKKMMMTHDDVRRVRTDGERRRAERRAGLFVYPQREGKCRYGAAELRQALRAPEDVKQL